MTDHPKADLARASRRTLRLVSRDLARQLNVFPLRDSDTELTVATDLKDLSAAEEKLAIQSGRRVTFELASSEAIRKAIEAAYPNTGRTDAVPRRPRPGQAHILFVDDDAMQRAAVRVMLGFEYNLTEAEDGEAALTIIGARPRFDLIITDLKMPGMQGDELLRRIRAGKDAPPVMVLTASESFESEDRLLDDGAADYLRKPIDATRLLRRVRATLMRYSAA